MFGKSSSGGGSSILGNSGGSSSDSVMSNIPGFQEEPACAKMCPKLTYQQRLFGFIGCCGAGYLLSLIGTLVLIGGLTDENVRIFAVLYVVGNIIALCATGFLLSPKSQCRKMWLPTRRWTTGFYLLMLIVVLVVAVLKQNVFLVLFLLFIEVCAGTWYAISYIPFGRKLFCAFLRQIGICMPCFFVYDSAKEQYDKNRNKDTASSKVSRFFGGGEDSERSQRESQV